MFSRNLVHSKYGRASIVVAANEDISKTIGINPASLKLKIFILSAVYAGLAGGLFASVLTSVSPGSFGLDMSMILVMMVIIGGGLTNFFGPVLGAIIFIALRDIFSTLTQHWYLFYGLLIVVIILFMPEGILGYFKVGKSGAQESLEELKPASLELKGVE